MSSPYSQGRALWAITKASFIAIFAQPVSVVFSFLFPIVFILIFGAFGRGGSTVFKIALDPVSDTSNIIYASLKENPSVKIIPYDDTTIMEEDLNKGQLTAVVRLDAKQDSIDRPVYTIRTRSTSASSNTFAAFLQLLDYTRLKSEMHMAGVKEQRITITPPQVAEGKKYRQIDFVLPGQIGFSILFATLFGIAFTFFSLREQLILKRFYASPVRPINILVGIGISRLFFQLINVVVLILVGHYFLHFTLQHGFVTFFNMVLLSIVLLFLLMGVGLIFSSIVKTDAPLPLLINLFGFPQMLLSGTFFPITVFPQWLQDLCYFLPLTQFNNAMRKISFDGLHIWDCWRELGILGIWIVLVYFLLAKLIRWE